MKKKLHFILVVAVSLQIIACLAIPLRPLSNATPTPTTVIGAREATPTESNESTPQVSTHCLDNPDGVVDRGLPCIQGIYESHYDVTTQTTPQQSRHVVSPLLAKFQLWAIAPGQLKGTAHLTYSLNAAYIDTAATGCQVQTEIVKPFSWDVELNGTYFTRPDGGIQIFVQAMPPQGPSYTEKFEDCPIPEREAPGVTWAAFGGEMFSGIYDHRQDNTLPADSKGEFYVVIHMQLVP